MRDVADRLTERLYQSIVIAVQGIPATVDPTKGGGLATADRRRAHYQPLRNSVNSRAELWKQPLEF